MKNYAFIFARGGSKGLPRKSIKMLAGKPLLQYSIEVGLACSSIEKVFVSSDDLEILDVAKGCGAEVITRPVELAQDATPEWLAWRHAIDYVIDRYGEFDSFVSLPPTSPLRSVQDVESAIDTLNNSDADICISITPASRSPYFNMVSVESNGFLELAITPDDAVVRRQDSPSVYDVTTVVYVSSPSFIKNAYGVFSGKAVGVLVPKERAVDIDDYYDFLMAEAIIKEKIDGKTISR